MPHKRSARMAEVNSRIDEAILALYNKQFEHISAAAKFFKVQRDTLSERLKGRKIHAQAHKSAQLFSKVEKDMLYQWCKRLTVTGHPISHQLTWEMAMEILSQCITKVNITNMQLITYPAIGKDWTKGFFK
ncbi:MAG: hypothetical protein M1840_006653 [Geoglossum simile]|nr:MAG: hypothetical protein M1840_006653 [Geoglossum simile]